MLEAVRGGYWGGGGRFGPSWSATWRQCDTAGDSGLGLRSLTTRLPQAGQKAGMRAIENLAYTPTQSQRSHRTYPRTASQGSQ
jgi:hypothetical protein